MKGGNQSLLRKVFLFILSRNKVYYVDYMRSSTFISKVCMNIMH